MKLSNLIENVCQQKFSMPPDQLYRCKHHSVCPIFERGVPIIANNLSLEKFDHELSFYGLVLDIKNCIRTNFYRQIDSCWKAVGR